MKDDTRVMRTRIKICGITRSEDVQAAARAGADAIGLNFYPPSPRFVSLERAAGLRGALPPFVSAVALFVNPSRADVDRMMAPGRRFGTSSVRSIAGLGVTQTISALASLRIRCSRRKPSIA